MRHIGPSSGTSSRSGFLLLCILGVGMCLFLLTQTLFQIRATSFALEELKASVGRLGGPQSRAAAELVEGSNARSAHAGAVAVEAPAVNAAPSCKPAPPVQAAAEDGPWHPKRPVVIGMAKGFEPVLSYRFVRSVREHCRECRIVILTDSAGLAAAQWFYDAFEVEPVVFANDLADVFEDNPSWRSYHPSSYRWLMIRDWMLKEEARTDGGVPDAIFFVDVRDSVFQGNPFDYMKQHGKGFYAFLEHKPATISQCGWNSGWVRDCFGDAGLEAVGSQVISCSGTSMASWADGLAYAQLLANEIATNKCERNGVDQGMHNYFLFSGKLAQVASAVIIAAAEDGPVASVQSFPTLTRDRAGRVLNELKAPYAVVHQYDRSQALKEQYDRQFPWLADHELVRK